MFYKILWCRSQMHCIVEYGDNVCASCPIDEWWSLDLMLNVHALNIFQSCIQSVFVSILALFCTLKYTSYTCIYVWHGSNSIMNTSASVSMFEALFAVFCNLYEYFMFCIQILVTCTNRSQYFINISEQPYTNNTNLTEYVHDKSTL